MRARLSKALRDLLYRLRTEGTSPGKLAAAVSVGVLIGCSPFYGLHLALCLLLARLLGLNPGLTYLAAHVSLPGLWPFLVLIELEVGRRLRGETYLDVSVEEIRRMGLGQVGIDLLVGSAAVGAVLAAFFGLLTFWATHRRRLHPEIAALREETARRYLDAGMAHWEFVRGKLRYDPLHMSLLRQGLLPSEGRLLDLGCGRGIVFSLVLAAREIARRGGYPADWAPPPHDLAFHGIEGRPKTAAAARRALGGEAVIETGDLRTAAFPQADAVLLLDVLHYLPVADQDSLLAKAAAALVPGGVLLLRDADAAAGWRFVAVRVQERFCSLARGHWRQRFHYRSARELERRLVALGLTVDAQPMSEGIPYANVLLTARRGTGMGPLL